MRRQTINRIPSPIRKAGILAALFTGLSAFCMAEEIRQWLVPLGGNAYLTSPAAGSKDMVEPSGMSGWICKGCGRQALSSPM